MYIRIRQAAVGEKDPQALPPLRLQSTPGGFVRNARNAATVLLQTGRDDPADVDCDNAAGSSRRTARNEPGSFPVT